MKTTTRHSHHRCGRKLATLFALFAATALTGWSQSGVWYEDSNNGQGGGLPLDFVSRHSTQTERDKWVTSREQINTWMVRVNSLKNYLDQDAAYAAELKATWGDKPICLDEGAPTSGNVNLGPSIQVLSTLKDHGFNVAYIAFQSLLSKWTTSDAPVQQQIDDAVYYLNNVLALYYPPESGIKIGIIDARPTKGWTYGPQYRDLKTQIRDRTGYHLDFVMVDWPIQRLVTDTDWNALKAARDLIRSKALNYGWSITKTGNPTAQDYKTSVIRGAQEHNTRMGMPDYPCQFAWTPQPDRSLDTDGTDAPTGLGTLCVFRHLAVVWP